MNELTKILALTAFAALPNISSAGIVTFVVDAKIHSSNTMNGLATGVYLDEGEGSQFLQTTMTHGS